MFLSDPLQAQFVRISLDIPTQTEISESQPVELSFIPDSLNGLQTLTGTAIYSITAAENLLILLKIHAEPLPDEISPGYSIPLDLTLAWRNDGKPKLPGNKMMPGIETFFPLSNTGLLITNIKDRPLLLHSYFFITIHADPYQYNFNSNFGNIYVHIEYN